MCVLLSEGYFPLKAQFKTLCSSPVFVGQSVLFAVQKCKEFPEISSIIYTRILSEDNIGFAILPFTTAMDFSN